MIENAPVLVEAKIREVSYIANENIVGSLTSVKRLFLDLSPLEIKFPADSIFYQLVHPKMYTCKEEWWNLLTLMLNSSPKLQFLKLTNEKRKFRKHGLVGRRWNEAKNVPECLLSHLKMFVWTRYRWDSSFSTRPIDSKEHNKLEERCKTLKELDGVVRASISCHLVFVVDSVE
ncbi:PREDICTED: F-box/FBD/LRR-repeat protein At3g52680 [Camelina sativa]|uniref:F-box/FBD/LRR-repeat protein At3g52680 n=1 Tax=Camelina sativa TaxID=90675 RepID=A0ABM0YXF5_CAMSA|nr:PREDICTED: F-box/FBD/LRR-repeat protein At3g52680 [Camelina sativa]